MDAKIDRLGEFAALKTRSWKFKAQIAEVASDLAGDWVERAYARQLVRNAWEAKVAADLAWFDEEAQSMGAALSIALYEARER